MAKKNKMTTNKNIPSCIELSATHEISIKQIPLEIKKLISLAIEGTCNALQIPSEYHHSTFSGSYTRKELESMEKYYQNMSLRYI